MCKQTTTIIWCRFCGKNNRDQTVTTHTCSEAWKNNQVGACKRLIRLKMERPTGTCVDCERDKAHAVFKYMFHQPSRPSDKKLERRRGGAVVSVYEGYAVPEEEEGGHDDDGKGETAGQAEEQEAEPAS